jgi:hypothetical protein
MARRVIAAVLVVLASVLAPFAVGARWAEQTLIDAQRFSETLSPLADSPEVHQVVESTISGAIIDALDVQDRLEGFLPTRVAEPVASGVNAAILTGVEAFVEGDEFGRVWLLLTSEAQEQFVRLLDRDAAGAITVEEGTLVLNTGVAAEMVKDKLVERGVPFIGDLDAGLIKGEVVLADTPNLQIVLDALRIFLPVAEWLWLAVLAMMMLSILLWRPRARGMMWAGLGLLIGGVLTWVALRMGTAVLVDSAGTTNVTELLQVTVSTVVRFLVNSLLVMITLGASLMLAGWLAGGTLSGKRLRDAVATSVQRWGIPLADGPVGRLAARRPMLTPTLRALVLIAAAAWLLTRHTLTPAAMMWTFAAAAAALLLVEVVEGAGVYRDRAHSGAVATD